jgi:hypothetical protein
MAVKLTEPGILKYVKYQFILTFVTSLPVFSQGCLRHIATVLF